MVADALVTKYSLGSTKDGRVIFWQIDEEGKARTGKIMAYRDNFHRDKSLHPTWFHTKYKTYNLSQVLFGTNLVAIPKNIGKPICIVEAEKTAVLANLIMPDKIWLATGGLQNLKLVSKINSIVYLFPDKGQCDKWKTKARELGLTFEVIDYMERTDMPVDADIADYILASDDLKIDNKYRDTLIGLDGYPIIWDIN